MRSKQAFLFFVQQMNFVLKFENHCILKKYFKWIRFTRSPQTLFYHALDRHSPSYYISIVKISFILILCKRHCRAEYEKVQ